MTTPTVPTSSSPRRRLSAAFFAIALTAAACGSADEPAATADLDTQTNAAGASDSTAPASAGVTRARMGDQLLAANQTITTGRFEGRLSLAGDADLPDGMELIFDGSYDTANQSSEVSLDISAIAMAAAAEEGTDLGPFAAMFEEPMVVRTVGGRSFVSWGLLSILSGGEGTWFEADASEADQITSGLGGAPTGSPTDFLSALEDANADLTELGTEEVRGVSTTHVRALVDLAELDATLTDEERAALEQEFGDLDVSAFPIDFWLDDDGLIRRYSVELDRSAAGGEGPSTGTLVFEFFDYGIDISIEAPPADEIISADQLDLEGFGFGN